MRGRNRYAVLAACGCGLVAALLVNQMMRPRGGETVQVVVAAREVPRGIVAAHPEEYFKLESLPRELVPPTAMTQLEQVKNKVVLRPIDAGQFCTARDLGEEESLTHDLPEGHLALAVRVTLDSSVAGFVTPGTRVDLICTVQDHDDPRVKLSKIFMTNMLVLAVNQEDARQDRVKVIGNPAVVTLAVKPAEAEKLTWVKDQGTVTMALRKPGDKTRATTHGATGPFDRVEAPPPAATTVEVPVARRKIEPGTPLTEANVRDYFELKPQLIAGLAPGTITELERLKDRTVRQRLAAGQCCTEDHFEGGAEVKVTYVQTIFNGSMQPVVREVVLPRRQ